MMPMLLVNTPQVWLRAPATTLNPTLRATTRSTGGAERVTSLGRHAMGTARGMPQYSPTWRGWGLVVSGQGRRSASRPIASGESRLKNAARRRGESAVVLQQDWRPGGTAIGRPENHSRAQEGETVEIVGEGHACHFQPISSEGRGQASQLHEDSPAVSRPVEPRPHRGDPGLEERR